MVKRKAEIKTERTVYPFVLLKDISELALKRARENEEDRFYNCITVILFSAFCIEAYLNWIGSINVPDWKSIDRSGPEKKLRAISKRINYELDFEKPPFKSFKEIKDYRDALVHAKTIRLVFEGEGYFDFGVDIPEMELTDWEKKTTLEIAEKIFDDTGLMIKELHKAAGFEEEPFFTQYSAKWEATPKE